jgi:hypothetical protein
VLFFVSYLIEGATRPSHNPWQQTICALIVGPEGWIQHAKFLLCGLSVVRRELVWLRILTSGVSGHGYPVVHALERVGLIGAGVFITELDPIQTVWLAVRVTTISIGLFVITRRFWRGQDGVDGSSSQSPVDSGRYWPCLTSAWGTIHPACSACTQGSSRGWRPSLTLSGGCHPRSDVDRTGLHAAKRLGAW